MTPIQTEGRSPNTDSLSRLFYRPIPFLGLLCDQPVCDVVFIDIAYILDRLASDTLGSHDLHISKSPVRV